MKILLILVLFQFNSPQISGYVKYYNEDKGFGYIISNNEEYYVYDECIIDEITDNDKVIFNYRNTRKGLEAINVRIAKTTK